MSLQLFLTSMFSACLGNTVAPPSPPRSTLKYFGYYWISNEELQNVNSYCNCSLLDNSWQAQNNLTLLIQRDLESLVEFRKNKMKAIIHVSGIFYKDITNKIPFDKKTFTNNWETYWNSIQPFVESNTILAFYLDEPSQQNLKQLEGLELVKQTISVYHNFHPSTEPIYTCVVLTANDIVQMNDGLFSVPDTIDWVGFDEYCCWSANECFKNISIAEKFSILQKHNPNKQYVLVGNGLKSNNSITENYLIHLNQLYFDLWKKTPKCVGMLIFSYNLGNNTVKQMPALENFLKENVPRIFQTK